MKIVFMYPILYKFRSMFKYLILITLLSGCHNDKKAEMATSTPTYSFVRINQDGHTVSSCFQSQPGLCLPVQSLTDLRFQITSSHAIKDGTYNRYMIAIPCEEVADADTAYDLTFGNKYQVDSYADNRNIVISEYVNSQVGDKVYISHSDVLYTITAVSHPAGGTEIDVSPSFPGIIPVCVSFFEVPVLLGQGATHNGVNVWNFESPNQAALSYSNGHCFELCVYWFEWEFSAPVSFPCNEIGFTSQDVGTTNCFEKSDSCHTTLMLYTPNENSLGFYSTYEQSVRLPLSLSRPQYPGEEEGYQKSNGQWVKLSERINKTYELRTDWMPEEWHERLRIALSCDFIYVTNENANLTYQQIYKQEEYEIEWDDDYDFPLAKGSAKVYLALLQSSINSNCV